MIAIFDLDYTLTQRGTWGRFVWRCVRRRPWFWLPLLVETARDQIAYKRGLRPRGAVKQSMLRWSLKRMRRDELERLAHDFARREVAGGLRPGAVAALAHHRARGDTLIIASAAVDLVAAPIADALGVEHLVCTELNWNSDRLRGCFANGNCYGTAKREAVQAYLAAHGWSDQPSVFYTDSQADFPMVDLATATIVVDPKPRTLVAANALGLPVQSWGVCPKGFEAPSCAPPEPALKREACAMRSDGDAAPVFSKSRISSP